MIKEYSSPASLLSDNAGFFDVDFGLGRFFSASVNCFTNKDTDSYALMVYEDNKKLFAVKTPGNDLIIDGERGLISELFNYLVSNGYDFSPFICETSLGKEIGNFLISEFGISAEETQKMNIMKTDELSSDKNEYIETALESDLTDISYLLELFSGECGLNEDKQDEAGLLDSLKNFRLIRKNGEIASICEISGRYISHVYTVRKYRNTGLAGFLVNSVKNQIISLYGFAMINCDGYNKKVNNLYESLGFKTVFSRSEFKITDRL